MVIVANGFEWVNNLRRDSNILTKSFPILYLEIMRVFHFSADYDSGEWRQTEEGEIVSLTAEELLRQDLFPSVREIIEHILNPNDGTVFATFEWDEKGNIIQATKRIEITYGPHTPRADSIPRNE